MGLVPRTYDNDDRILEIHVSCAIVLAAVFGQRLQNDITEPLAENTNETQTNGLKIAQSSTR